MKIYPKQLHSLKAIEEEKKRLRKQLKELEEEDLFSFGKKGGKDSKHDGDDDAPGGFDLSSILGMLPVSSPYLATLLPIIQKQVTRFVGNKFGIANNAGATANTATATTAEPGVMSKVKKTAINAGKEVLFGYLKWKAIELAYKGARHVIKTQREKKKAATM